MQEEPIKVGVIMDLTGPLSFLGVATQAWVGRLKWCPVSITLE